MKRGRDIVVQGRMESNTTEKDGQKRTYWGISVDSFDFCGKNESVSADPAPTEVEPPEGLPF